MVAVGWGPWAVLFCALTLEYSLIAMGVEAGIVARARGGPWLVFIGAEGLGRTAFLCATSVLVLVRPGRVWVTPLAPARARSLLWLHALLFTAFWFTTRAMLGSPEPPAGPVWLWVSVWLLLGACNAATLWLGLVGRPRLQPMSLLAALSAGVAMAWAMSHLGWWTQDYWRPFSGAALSLAAFFLKLVFSGVTVDAQNYLLKLDDFTVDVEGGCSGLESMTMMIGLGLVYLAVFRRELRFPRAFLLILLGLLLTWLGNGLRLALMTWIGARYGANAALAGFHSKAGWVIFSSIALGIAFVGHHSRWFSRPRAGARRVEHEFVTAFLLPLMVLLAVALVSGMLGQSGGPWYAVRMALGLFTLALMWHGYSADLRWREPGLLGACLVGVSVGLLWLGSAWLLSQRAKGTEAAEVGGWLVVRAIGFSTIVPLAEELAFRGYLLRVLQNRDFETVSYRTGSWWAIAGSSIVFGALHERWLAATLAGAAYALIQVRNGRLRDAVLAHATTNATLAAFALALGDPALFG